MTAVREQVKLKEKKKEKEKENKADDELLLYSPLLEALVKFGSRELFVVNTAGSVLLYLHLHAQAQPIMSAYNSQNMDMGTIGTAILPLPLDTPTAIPQETLVVVGKILRSMNFVLEQILPGLTISVKKLGTELMDGNRVGVRIQLMSGKNGKEIALKYESDGIKKIIYVFPLLILVYNQSSVTVAVDALDAGVFEYLLGELLRIISEKGKRTAAFYRS